MRKATKHNSMKIFTALAAFTILVLTLFAWPTAQGGESAPTDNVWGYESLPAEPVLVKGVKAQIPNQLLADLRSAK